MERKTSSRARMARRRSGVMTSLCVGLVSWLLLTVTPSPVAGQGTFNLMGGRSHPGLAWSVYDTAHFRIVYPDGLAEVALRAGRIAEQAYDAQRQTLSLTLGRRLYIFLSDRDQIPNGATSPFGYMFIYVNPARYPTLFSSTSGWLEQVIPHELVHALLFENTRGWWDRILLLAGTSVPREIQEGMAQFYGGETWSVQRGDRYLNLLVRSRQTSAALSGLDAGPGEYARGFAGIKWLQPSIGDREMGRIFSPDGRGWRRFSFGRRFKEVTGLAYGDVQKEWRQAVDVYYNARAGTAERALALGPTLKDVDADYLLAVKESPTKKGLAFSGVRDRRSPNYALYYLDYATRRLTRLAEKNIRDNFSFDPAGDRLAFTRWHYGARGDLLADVFLVDLRTGAETAATRDERALDPLFVSASDLVYVRQRGLVSNLYRLSLAPGSIPEPLTMFDDERYFWDLSVSGDGRYVAAAFLHPSDRRQGLLVVDLTTRQIVEHPQPALCRFPLFAPGSTTEILFTSEAGGVLNVWRLDATRGTTSAVTRQADSVLVTSWPETGRAIGIRQVEPGRNEAFTLDPQREVPPASPPAQLQPYFTDWLRAKPGTPLVFDQGPQPGEVAGPFRSLSTFRPLGVMPVVAFIRNRLAVGVSGLAADMPGEHTLVADAIVGVQADHPVNGGVTYLNRATGADIVAQVARRDVTTFAFYGTDDLFERIGAARVRLARDWALTSRYGSHGLRVMAAVTDSTVLPRDATSGPVPDAVPAREAEDYRLWSVVAGYLFAQVRPAESFPVDAAGSGASYQYSRSYAGQLFSFHDVAIRAYVLKPAARAVVRLFASAAVDAQTGTAPAQLRPGLAKYSSGNTLLNISSQVQVRGGEQYLPGNRQFTSTAELRLPLGRVIEPMLFVDTVVASDPGADSGRQTSSRTSVGAGLRFPPVLGSSVELGWANVVSGGAPQRGWKFYVAVGPDLPFR